eukprot:TRINITY_DN854_c0_g1_i2.p1 TRINITY_DN854_c0_g1~~TRINITY_DN854_c0_g1_i2.p1  ORF type:complete len:146 (-),score=7.53 TRINITY_DN854_c0_g1_i2:529-966(-)
MRWGFFALWYTETVFCLILGHLFFVLQLDGVIEWNWFIIFLPPVLSSPGLAYFIYCIYKDHRYFSRENGMWFLLVILADVCTWFVFLALKLQYGVMSWWGTMIPFWIALAFFAVVSFVHSRNIIKHYRYCDVFFGIVAHHIFLEL